MNTTPAQTPSTINVSVATPDVGSADVVEVRDLHCRYGDFEAVRGIDLTVRRGELVALLGTNGAGKTTTLETLEGHRRPDGGHVRVLGHDPTTDRRAIAADVGIVLQEAGLPGCLTVAEAVRTWTRLHPSSAATSARRARDLDAVLDEVGLLQRRSVPVKQLSGGEKRRLDLALAVVTRPALLFLDEPTTGMDPEARVRTWAVIQGLLARGTTIVLTTHYLEEAEELADRIAIMDGGRIVAQGTLAQIVDPHPSSIGWRQPPGVSLDELPPIRGRVRMTGDLGTRRVVVETHTLQQDLSTLMRWADDAGHTLEQLSAPHASLAQVFRALAGGTGHAGDEHAGDEHVSDGHATDGREVR